MRTGIITKVVNDNNGEIADDATGAGVTFSRSELKPSSFYTRGAKVGDRVRFELMFYGVASVVQLEG